MKTVRKDVRTSPTESIIGSFFNSRKDSRAGNNRPFMILPAIVDSDLRNASFVNCVLDGIDLKGTDLRGAEFRNCTIRDVDFSEAINVDGARFIDTTVDDVVFMYRDREYLEQFFTAAHLRSGATWKKTDLDRLIEGQTPRNGYWIKEGAVTGLDLAHRDLSDSRFENVDFTGASMAGASLEDSRLINCTFDRAILRDADLNDAKIEGGSFTGADFSGATVDGAYRDFLRSQGVRNYDAIRWIDPPPKQRNRFAVPEAPDFTGYAFPSFSWEETGVSVSSRDVVTDRWTFFFFPDFMMHKDRTATYLNFVQSVIDDGTVTPARSYIVNATYFPYHAARSAWLGAFSLTEDRLDGHRVIDDAPPAMFLQRLAVSTLPTLIVTGPDGTIRFHGNYLGEETEEEVLRRLRPDR